VSITSEQFALVDVVEQMCAAKKIDFRPLRLAGGIMDKNVKPLTLDHTVRAFLNFMNAYKIRHAPVIDFPTGDKKYSFIGVVSERDVLRLKPKAAKDSNDEDIDPRATKQLLQQIVARNPKSASPDTPVPDVITTMIDNHIDMVPVMVDTELVGIITTTDVLKLFTQLDNAIGSLCPELQDQADPPRQKPLDDAEAPLFSWVSQTVDRIMTEDVVCLEPTHTLADTIEVMKQGKFRHAPVLDEHGRLAGIISDRDILRQLPFAGRRPPKESPRFRAHLFKVDHETPQLQLGVTEFMTRATTHIGPDCRICEAAKTLRSIKIGCLPIVDKQLNVLGIITVADLMRVLLPAYEPTGQSQH
jgi:CBS domain-containing protein